jgi:zinc protease
MRKRLFALGLLSALIAGCARGEKPPEAPEKDVTATRPVASAAENPAATQAAQAGTLALSGGTFTLQLDGKASAGAGDPLPVATKGKDYGAETFRSVNQRDEIVSTLENGLVVIVKRVSSPVVSVRAYAKTGGVYEGKWLGGGLSHLLEHLVAGGSTEKRTEAENRNILQTLGNNSNAYTTTDHTAYFVNTTPDRMEKAVDLVAGWVFGAKITPDEYGREYEVVQRELEMGKGEPDRVFYYLSNANRYRVSPARVPVIGYQEVIQGLSRDDVYRYFKLAYQPQNMLFSVSGDIDPELMLHAVQKQVKDYPPGREFDHNIPGEPPVLAPRTVVATFPKLGQAKMQLGFPTVRLDHPDLYALDLLAQVLGEGESSLLVEEIRDKRQLASNLGVASDTPSYVDGTFEVSLELDPENIAKATDAVLAELDKIKAKPIDAGRLERAKTLVKAARVKRLQKSEDIGGALATDFLLTGDLHFSDRYVERIGQVTAEQVQAVARRYFDRSRLLTTVLLPAEYAGAGGLPKAEEVIRAAAPTTQPKQENPQSAVTRVVLDNGTILLHKRITTSPLVAINTYALGGVTAESKETNGLGNLAMELAPRGTKTRSAQQIAEFFDSIGGDLETSCGNNSWSWNATCLKEDFSRAMEVYGDVLANPTFPDAEVAQMKKRVAAAIRGQDADWTQQAFRFFKTSFYGPKNSPYQFMPVGTESNVNAFTAEQVKRWYAGRVLTARRVMAIYGDVTLDAAKELANKHVGRGPKIEAADLPSAKLGTPPRPGEGKPAVEVTRVETLKTAQALAAVVIGYESNSVIGDPANYPLAVADTMTSGYGYPTGYLHEILRGRGLVYVVHAQNVPGRSSGMTGSFFVYAGCDPKNVNEVIDVILENIARVQGTPQDVNEDWFARSKELAVVTDAMDNETPVEQAAQAALDELNGLGYDYAKQFPGKIRAVTLDDVKSVARGRLDKAVVTVSTPSPELVKVSKGKREYDSFPPVDLTPKGVQHDAP